MSILGQKNVFAATDKNSSRVGKDVLAYCSRCKMNLSHTIVTMTADEKPDRVLCNTCKSERAFRGPKDEPKPKASKTPKLGGVRGGDGEDGELGELDVTKALLGDTAGKKKAKPKAKAKAKKPKDDSEAKASAKAGTSIPLSMQAGTAEDIALFESKLNINKNNLTNAKQYRASERFAVGDILNHTTFGTGFIAAENGMNKIEVLFREGRKLLVNAPK